MSQTVHFTRRYRQPLIPMRYPSLFIRNLQCNCVFIITDLSCVIDICLVTKCLIITCLGLNYGDSANQ